MVRATPGTLFIRVWSRVLFLAPRIFRAADFARVGISEYALRANTSFLVGFPRVYFQSGRRHLGPQTLGVYPGRAAR